MKKLLLALALVLWAIPAQAQNVTCADRPAGDSTNACANTRFVILNGGFWVADGVVAVNNSPTYTTVRVSRSNVGNAGATLQLGHDAYMWTLIGNQLSGGDLLLRNPVGGNVLVFPEIGGCVGIQASLTNCTAGYMLDVGPAAGSAFMRINGATFVANQGPMLAFSGGSTVLGRIGSDCVFFGATACNNDIYINGPASSRHIGFYNWGGVMIKNTPTVVPTQYVGGALTVNTDTRNTFVGGNAITGQSDVNTGGNFPTVITALANVIDTTVGGPGATVWGIYSHCDVKGLAECAAVEGTASNRNAAPGVPPIASVPAAPQPFPVALKATCGGQISPSAPGLFGCSVGLWIHYYEGNGGWPFLYGIYLTEGIASTAGILVNATSLLSPTTSAEFRSAGGVGQRGVVIRNMGASSANLALDFQNSAGASIANIQFNGVINFTNGGVVHSLSNFSLNNAGFQHQFVSGGTFTANRAFTITLNDTARTLNMGGNITTANDFITAGNFSLTLTQTGATNVTLPTAGLLATTSNTLGDFAATTSAQLAGVISDETGSGSLVFATSPIFVSSIVTPIIHGGSAANSSLFLRSTSGAGTSDTIVIQTGSQVEAGRITTGQQWQIGSNFAPASGVKMQISANAAALAAPIIGTVIHVGNVDGASTRLSMDAFGTGFFPSTIYRQARGTSAAKTATQSGDFMGSFFALGYGATGYLNNAGSGLVMVAVDNFTDTAGGSRAELWATQASTTTSGAVARFDRPTTATQTALTIFDVDNAALERVTVGAADSGGVGFKVLRIPN